MHAVSLVGLFMSWRVVVALAVPLSTLLTAPAQARCQIGKIAELPVTMIDMKPMVTAKINGVEAVFAADSGAFFSTITPATAAQYQLKTYPAPRELHITGIGGETEMAVAKVKTFTLAGVDVPNVEFLVGGGEAGGGSVGLLGQNVFRLGDVEYDLARGVIRLIKEDDCKKVNLAYWAVDGDAVSMMEIQSTTPASPHTTGDAWLNGLKIRVMFDTGAHASYVSRRTAERAGIKLDSPGVVDAGYTAGIGRAQTKSWIAPVASFKVGEEEIRNTRLRIGEQMLQNADMLLGADFFLSHHVYVSSRQSRLFFTYNGGPVFNLATGNVAAVAGGDVGTVAAAEPGDAAGFARRGAALAARREFERALTDLDRACKLAPKEPDFFYERGVAHSENQQADLALADFDRAIALKPDHVPALMARAEQRLAGKSEAPAIQDLDAVDRFAAKEADVRLRLSQAYFRADLLPQAAAQADLWVAAHAADSRLGLALRERCAIGGMAGDNLRRALDDCNASLRGIARSDPRTAQTQAVRGMVLLRLGDYGKSIGDFDSALKVAPRDAWALYGRGIAKKRAGRPDFDADLSAALQAAPTIAVRFQRHGLAP